MVLAGGLSEEDIAVNNRRIVTKSVPSGE